MYSSLIGGSADRGNTLHPSTQSSSDTVDASLASGHSSTLSPLDTTTQPAVTSGGGHTLDNCNTSVQLQASVHIAIGILYDAFSDSMRECSVNAQDAPHPGWSHIEPQSRACHCQRPTYCVVPTYSTLQPACSECCPNHSPHAALHAQ